MEDRRRGEKVGGQQTNKQRERDDDIISIGMYFAPEGQIVLSAVGVMQSQWKK